MRQPGFVSADEREEVLPIPLLGRRPIARARGIAAVGDEPPGEPKRQPVVREEHGGDRREHIGLGPPQPRKLGDGQAGDGNGADRVGPCRRPQAIDEVGGVGCRLGVVPQLGRPQHVPSGVKDDHAVLLPGDGHGSRRGQPRCCNGERRFPRRRVLLAAGRRGGGVRRPARPEELSGVGVSELDFARRGRRVDPEDERQRLVSERRAAARSRAGRAARGRIPGRQGQPRRTLRRAARGAHRGDGWAPRANWPSQHRGRH